MRKIILILLFLFLLPKISIAFNPKLIKELRAEIVKEGKLLISGRIKEINLFLYIPQEGLERVEVYPNNFELVKDKFGNEMIKIKILNPSSAEIPYKVKFIVRIKEKDVKNAEIAFNYSHFLKRTSLTDWNRKIEAIAYGKETLEQKVSRLVRWIKNNLKYEINPLSQITKSSLETFHNKRGACGEFSNLLTAFLRSQNIPVRYVVGFAIPSEELNTSQFWSHAWIEVLMHGKWIPIDPTWIEGGYLDATHIKLANLLDSNFTESLSYKGWGSVEWLPKKPTLKILDLKEKTLNFTVESPIKVFGDSVFLINLTNLDKEGLYSINLISCVDESGKSLFKIFSPKRILWLKNGDKIFWIVKAPKVSKFERLICPITLIVNGKIVKQIPLRVEGEKEIVEIASLNKSLPVGEIYEMKVKKRGIFFSDFSSLFKEDYKLKFQMPAIGNFNFYFYSPEGWARFSFSSYEKLSFKIENLTYNLTNSNLTLSFFLINLDSKPTLTTFKILLNGNEILRERVNVIRKVFIQKRIILKEGCNLLRIEVKDNIPNYEEFIVCIEKKKAEGFLKKFINYISAILNFLKRLIRM